MRSRFINEVVGVFFRFFEIVNVDLFILVCGRNMTFRLFAKASKICTLLAI